MRLLSILVFLSSFSYAQIIETRKLQLDSIVTNIPQEKLRHLDSLHSFLHSAGNNNEERVFMFYGLFAIHYKYDYKRAGKGKNIEYTPYYTASKKSGVCRDFAALFKELCDRSKIPCVVAQGRVKVSLLNGIADFFSLRLKKPNHAWNIVKYNNRWHLMDPTWGTVNSVEKYYGEDENGKKKYIGQVEISSRMYYDAPSNYMYNKRNAIHPAFYVSKNVNEYYHVRSKSRRRDDWDSSYNYIAALDSMSNNPYYFFTSEFNDEVYTYSRQKSLSYYIRLEFHELEHKRSKWNPLTVDDCNKHLLDLNRILELLHKQGDFGLDKLFEDHFKDVEKKIQKLMKEIQNTGRSR